MRLDMLLDWKEIKELVDDGVVTAKQVRTHSSVRIRTSTHMCVHTYIQRCVHLFAQTRII